MTVLYSNDFEAEAAGALAAFSVAAGASFQVQTGAIAPASAVRGSKHFGRNSDGDSIYWNGSPALTSQGCRIAQKFVATSRVGILLRHQAGQNDRCYRLYYEVQSGNLRGTILARNNGNLASQSSGYTIPVTAGDVVHMEATAVGTALEIRVWVGSAARPTAATVTMTDATYSAGAVGLCKLGAFEWTACDDLVIADGPEGLDYYYSGGGDTTAPTLTSPTGTQTGSTTASGTVSTNEGDGTLYRLASTNATETAATVKAAALTQAVTATGVQNVTFSGLTASTTYYAHYVHRDAAGNDSAVASSASFTTAAAGDTTPPSLSAPSGTATGGTTATGSVTTNEANGTLYRYASTNASESAATIKAAGLTQTVSATGAQSASFTGLTPGATYYAHFVHRDAAGNDSAVASSASFTTTAPTATLTVPVVNNTNTSLPSTTLPRVTVDRLSDGVQILNLASQATNSGGNLVLASASLTAGVDYMVSAWNADGSLAMIVKATAA